MDPTTLIPTPDAIPVHWGWFHILLLVTFTLHILLMNIMLGTVFIAAVNHFTRDGAGSPPTKAVAEKLPFTIAFAVNFGVAPLLFAQVLYGHFIYASSILMGTFWLSIIGILIAAYYLAYIYKYKYLQLERGRALLTGSICIMLLFIAFLFSNNFTLMLHPESWTRYFDSPGGLLLNLADPTIWSRYLHFITSAIAVGGMSIALFFSYRKHTGDPEAAPWIGYGCKWFAYTTFINFGIGAWFLGSLPQGLVSLHTATGVFFLIFLICGIIAAVFAALLALKERVLPAFYSLLAAIVLMILVRDMLRTLYLQPWFSRSELTVQASYSPLLVFLLFFIGGLALIGWMLKITFQNTDNQEVQS